MWKWLPTEEFSKAHGLTWRRGRAELQAAAPQAPARAETPPALAAVDEAQVQVGDFLIEAVPKAIAEARHDLPNLVREVGDRSAAFIIHNAKNPSASPALLISPDELSRRMSVAKATRTLGQVIDALPFKSRVAGALDLSLPDDVAPNLLLPLRSSPPRKPAKAKVAAAPRVELRGRGGS